MVSMFPHPTCFLLDRGSIFDLLIVLDILLDLLEDQEVFLFNFAHSLNQGVVLLLEGKPLLFAVDCEELLPEEGALFVEAFMLFAEGLELFIEIEESLLPKSGFSLKVFNVFWGDFSVALLIIFWGVFISFLARRIFILTLCLHLLLLLYP